MNKVWTVQSGDGYDCWQIHCFCSSAEIAQKEKQRIEREITKIKEQYGKETGMDYDTVLDEVLYSGFDDREFAEDYEELSGSVYLWQAKHSLLIVGEITVVENIVI